MTTSSSPLKQTGDMANLMSPPEPAKLEVFSSDGHNTPTPGSPSPTSDDAQRVSDPAPPLSPPISPLVTVDDIVMIDDPSTSAGERDPILFPEHDQEQVSQHETLFVPEVPVDNTRRRIDEHVSDRRAQLFRDTSPPKQEDYELILYFESRVMELYTQDRKAWLKRERAQLEEDRRARGHKKRVKLQSTLPTKTPTIRIQTIRKEAQRSRAAKAPQVTKAAPQPKPRPARAGPTAPVPQAKPTTVKPTIVKPTIVLRAPSEPVTAEPSPRRMVAPTRVDTDFESLPDYCPPISSLPNRPNSLKVDWKGSPMDLTDDPHRHLLHRDELLLASNLRLSCATYLTSKRRMFMRRLECLRNKKDFRKTDAQQTCKIDVNKASKLWMAFHNVGWLDPCWVERFL
ncbi:SWIRM domain-containing protein [Xylariaceae sp. FL0594]|nr:SWIRM domain-containing protein [Xylariaceae sp. FL0594]